MTTEVIHKTILKCDRCGKTVESDAGCVNLTGFKGQRKLTWTWTEYGIVPEGQLCLAQKNRKELSRDFCDECADAVYVTLAPLLRGEK